MPIQPKDVFDRLSKEIQAQIRDELSEILKEVIDEQLNAHNAKATHTPKERLPSPVLSQRVLLPSGTP